jgi:hypothetical protein
MKLTISSLYILLLIAVVSSCKKETTGHSNANQKITSYTEDFTAPGVGHVVETYNVSYDGQGRITSIESATKKGHRMVYLYSGNDRFTYDKYEDDKVTLHNDYFINAELGLIDSTYQYNIQRDTSSAKYLYNSDKKLIKQKQYIHNYLLPPVWYNTVAYQYDINGTLTKESDNYYETSYGYDDEVENTVKLEPFYFPVQGRLPSHTFTTRFGTTITIVHTYTFDSNKRISSEKASSSDGRVTVTTYTYQ